MSRFLQLVLDMFDGATTKALQGFGTDNRPSPQKRKPRQPKRLKPQSLMGGLHSDANLLLPAPAMHGPHMPSEPLGQVLPKAHYAHPRATRRIQLGTTDVAYAFRRGKRRTIGMAIGPDGLEVSAPRWVTLGEVESALHEKADWIARKLVEMQERQQQLGAARIVWADGVVLPYLGDQLKVVLDSTTTLKKNSAQFEVAPQRSDGEALAFDLSAEAGAKESVQQAAQENEGKGLAMQASSPLLHTLRLGLPLNAEPQQIRDAVQAWLMRQAKALFVERLNHFAPQLGVQWQSVSLSSAATRWGSASANGAIRLNWRLVHHKRDVIDYVVAHELSHLRVMDHSPRFWETVQSIMPDYAQRRRVLKDEPLPPWS
jgi:predicted metal-dependent hydrolase